MLQPSHHDIHTAARKSSFLMNSQKMKIIASLGSSQTQLLQYFPGSLKTPACISVFLRFLSKYWISFPRSQFLVASTHAVTWRAFTEYKKLTLKSHWFQLTPSARSVYGTWTKSTTGKAQQPERGGGTEITDTSEKW